MIVVLLCRGPDCGACPCNCKRKVLVVLAVADVGLQLPSAASVDMNANVCRAMRKEDVHEAISMEDFLQVQLARMFATAFVYGVYTQLARVFVAAFGWKLYTRLHLKQYM